MKILQVNVVYGHGSTGKIIADIDANLKAKGHRSIVCYGRKDCGEQSGEIYKFCSEAEAGANKIANCLGALMYGGNLLATRKLINIIRKKAPDIVHLHCINGYCVNIYRLLRFLAKENIPTLVTHHAEFFYTANCGHALDCMKFADNDGCRNCPTPRTATGALFLDRAHASWGRMRDAFRTFASGKLVFIAVSPWVGGRSALSTVTAGYPCHVVENGLDTGIFHSADDRFLARSLVPGCRSKMVLHVTASFSDEPDAFKGGDKIVALARMMPDVSFVVAASYVKVQAELPDNLYIYGRTSNQQELAALYRAADATVIASKRETFSMIVAESLCCGTPLVGFEAGGPETIAIDDYCRFVPYGDMVALKNALENILSKDFDRREISHIAMNKFDSKVMADKYIELYKSMLQ